MQLDFLARQAYYIDHLAPLWNELPAYERGSFYVLGEKAQEYAARKLRNPKIYPYIDEGECGVNPIITASYGDAVRAADFTALSTAKRHVTLLEHGVGLTFGKAAYADGLGQRDKCSLIPVQSQYILNKVNPEIKHIPHPIVGVPKLDKWFISFGEDHVMPKKPTIAFAFHHGDKFSRPAEIGSAWQHYVDYFPYLSKKYRWIFHAHPSAQPKLLDSYKLWGLEYLEDMEEVFKQADILVNDCGSSAYEFCATGKPVILLNAPWFDKKSTWGIRFWDYSDIGFQVENPESLEMFVDRVVASPDEHKTQRRRMVHDLFPHFGVSTLALISTLRSELDKIKPLVIPKEIKPRTKIFTKSIRTSKEQGVIYMCFGVNAQQDLEKSIDTLRSTGSTLPVAVVGDVKKLEGVTCLEWKGKSPFDPTKNSHFQFRAARVKPFLHEYSPFQQTLYVDTDTEFLSCPDEAFGFLKNWDFVIAQERLMLSELYNKRGAGWEHDISERDATIESFGANNGDFPFWNSGVFFWKKNELTKQLFSLWYTEWLKFQGWDEQKALMRAGNKSKARIFVLGEIWNFPHREEVKEKIHQGARIILHEYGRGSSRTDIGESI